MIKHHPNLKGKLYSLEPGNWVMSTWVASSSGDLHVEHDSRSSTLVRIPRMALVLHLGETLYGAWHHVVYQDMVGWVWGRLFTPVDVEGEEKSEP